DHLILAAAAIGGDHVQRSDGVRGIVIVALRENPAAQDVAGLRAELVSRENVRGEAALRGARIEAFHTDRRLAPRGEEQPDDATQSRGNVTRWQRLCYVTHSRSGLISIRAG